MNIELSGNETGLVLYLNMEDTGFGNSLILNNQSSLGNLFDAETFGYTDFSPYLINHDEYDMDLINLGPNITTCTPPITLNVEYENYKEIIWSTGSTASTIEVLSPGLYTVVMETELCNFNYDTIQIDISVNVIIENSISLCENEFIEINGILYSSEGNYTDTIYSEGFCDTIYEINIEMNSLPQINLGNDTTLCNETMLLNANNFGAQFLWQDGSQDQYFTVTETGWYSVSVTNDNCISSDSIFITINEVTIDLGSDFETCNPNYTLETDSSFTNYLWQDGSTSSTYSTSEFGTFWVEVNDSLGCTDTDTIVISYNSNFNFNLGVDQFLCSGSTYFLEPTIQGTQYLWNTGSTQNTLEVTSSGEYSLSVTEDLCQYSDTINITFYSPEASFTSNIISGCSPLLVEFLDLSSSEYSEIQSWVWDFGDGQTSYINNPSHEYQYEGVYPVTLTITDINNCYSTTNIDHLINVIPQPEVDFTFSPENPTIFSPQVLFTSQTSNATDWYWQFGDGTTSNEINPLHIYNEPGFYYVTLDVSAENGCSNSISWSLFIETPLNIYVPNSFSPNNDGLNDLFIPVISGLSTTAKYHFEIYSRWGIKVFESYDFTEGWLGEGSSLKDNGLNYYTKDGIYTWIITVTENDKTKDLKLKGHVSVFR